MKKNTKITILLLAAAVGFSFGYAYVAHAKTIDYLYCADSVVCDDTSPYSCRIEDKKNFLWIVNFPALKPIMNAGKYTFSVAIAQSARYFSYKTCIYKNNESYVQLIQTPKSPFVILPVEKGFKWNFRTLSDAICTDNKSVQVKECPFQYSIIDFKN